MSQVDKISDITAQAVADYLRIAELTEDDEAEILRYAQGVVSRRRKTKD